LPDTIQFSSGSQSIYTYAANGAKQKIVYKTSPEDMNLPVTSLDQVLQTVSNAKITSTDYCGNYIYENDTLKMILTPEGYIQNGVYYYYLKDHLGSNRVVLRQDGAIVERDNYYPSGARFGESVLNGGSVQPYRHTGMEMQGMHGLNWIDNEARMRSVNVPEFTTLDPLAEKYYSISPYAYVLNNPVRNVDPDGRIVKIGDVNDRKEVLSMINSRAAGTFGINKQGDLYVIQKEGSAGFSTEYRDKLITAIDSKNTVNIDINQTVTIGGKTKDVDKDSGGGTTLTGTHKDATTGVVVDKWATVTISGKENNTEKDTNGKTLVSEAKDILMHELVGHAIPAIVGTDTGNAVDNENKVRAQYPEGQNQLRQKDPDHKE